MELPVFDHAFGITVVILQEKILIAASRKPVARLKAQVRVQVPTAAFDDQQREADPLVEALVIDGCLAVASVAYIVGIVGKPHRNPELELSAEAPVELEYPRQRNPVPATRRIASPAVRLMLELQHPESHELVPAGNRSAQPERRVIIALGERFRFLVYIPKGLLRIGKEQVSMKRKHALDQDLIIFIVQLADNKVGTLCNNCPVKLRRALCGRK